LVILLLRFFPEAFNFLLELLVKSELHDLKFFLFCVLGHFKLLLLAPELSCMLLVESFLIVLQVNLATSFKAMFLILEQLILFSLEISHLLFVFYFLLLTIICQLFFHIWSCRGKLKFLLHLLDLSLILLLLFSFDIFYFSLHQIIQISLLTLNFSIHFSFHILNLLIVFCLDLSLLSFQLIDINLLALE